MRYISLTLSLLCLCALSLPALAAAAPTPYDSTFVSDKMPQPLDGPKSFAKLIVYPEAAKKEKIEGKVIISAFVNEHGKVEQTEIKAGVRDDLNKAAIQALVNSEWKPGEKDGKAVGYWVTVPINFKLEQKKK